MTRRFPAAGLVAAACASLVSCGLLSGDRADPSAAAGWWAEKVESAPPDFLAVYVEAAEVHRRHGTAATYVQFRGGHNMLGKVGVEVRLPCPPPEDVLIRMRDRAAGSAPSQTPTTAEACRGCTAEEAERIWRDAAEAVARRRSE